MAGDAKSDVETLLGCFQKGASQRSRKERGGGQRKHMPSTSGTSSEVAHYSDANPAEKNPRTPVGKDDQIGSSLEHSNGDVILKKSSVCKQVSPGVFYGSPLGKPATKPPQLLRLLNDIRRDLAGQNQSREVDSAGGFTQATATRTAIWATFPQQEQAIQFAESGSDSELVVFQYQDHINGQRRFLATTYEEFWYRYTRMIADYRHHYEIIQDGKPCHLYFDLEFNRRVNTEADGETMVDLLLLMVETSFLDIYDLKYDMSWTVELDSSTEEKFSRHLIIHAPHLAFKNNSHVGAFVGEICKRIHEAKERNEEMSCLFVQADSRPGHHPVLFVDQGVYSRNRSFRLPFSSKAGKTAKLTPTKRFRCKTSDKIQVFMDSLICRVEDSCERLLTFRQEDPGRGGTLDFASWKHTPVDPRRRPACLSGKSPFPSLDIFIESVACIGNVKGRIRSWYWFSEYGVVIYNISENRFCENIGRFHKSNNVMYIVDFRTAGYYQKCHDPDCRGYRSSLRPIPRHTIPPEYPLSGAPPRVSRQYEDGSKSFFQEQSEDEAWWDEVISSMSSLECASESQESKQVSQFSKDTTKDNDEWWCAVEQELVNLENTSLRTPPYYSDTISLPGDGGAYSTKACFNCLPFRHFGASVEQKVLP